MKKSTESSSASYSGILGHEGAVERLRSALRRGRLAHALLFAGPEGVGKWLAAGVLARAILCGKGDEPCGRCDACARGAPGRLFEIRKPTDKQVISIAQVHDLLRSLSLRSAEARVVLIDHAEELSEEAMNALLKTLEEPPERTVTILVTSAPSMILPTLRSRCQTVLFHALPNGVVEKFLRERGTPEPEFVAALAEGSIGRALALPPDVSEWRVRTADFLEKALAGDLNPIVEAITGVKAPEGQREAARLTLGAALLALREAHRAAAGAPLSLHVAPPALLARGLDLDDLADRIESVLDHLRMIDRNANVGLAVEDALLRI